MLEGAVIFLGYLSSSFAIERHKQFHTEITEYTEFTPRIFTYLA